ncbi:MAG: Holliday junction resolvase RuvX [Syntrophales bacterium]|nr:Holliday junction resolvase RuvX [Syntrophales bacterium]
MKILGLDYGDRRIGVAVSDESELVAEGLTTIVRKNRRTDLHALGELIEANRVEEIVIGYPIRLDGMEGIQCEKVKQFADLVKRIFHRPVIFWDEAFTTKDAEDMMMRVNVKKERRRSMVDRIAASMILQNYLDARRKNDKDGTRE